jgi:molecular chaperone GrpE
VTDARLAGPDSGPAKEQIVIKDNRKIDAEGRPKDTTASGADETTADGKTPPTTAQSEATMGQPGSPATGDNGDQETPETTDEVVTGEVVAETAEAKPVPALGAELEALRSELDERLKDLQRVTAEYSNYRKRVERDRSAVVEQAIGMVISALLPILDDLDRAREHDDLVGPFAAVADQLNAALAKFGLTGFGEVGDVFDPTRHEAVAHQTSADVSESTCVAVMRRGYLLGDRLLRAALVAVADPE